MTSSAARTVSNLSPERQTPPLPAALTPSCHMSWLSLTQPGQGRELRLETAVSLSAELMVCQSPNPTCMW